ncbi:hypothetical protein NC651_029236 [Populus alba x Populus x berolinensis]|nr:hypothetical protein NC651_029236 [Populus alba x Populus x berolinensis]
MTLTYQPCRDQLATGSNIYAFNSPLLKQSSSCALYVNIHNKSFSFPSFEDGTDSLEGYPPIDSPTYDVGLSLSISLPCVLEYYSLGGFKCSMPETLSSSIVALVLMQATEFSFMPLYKFGGKDRMRMAIAV